MGGIKAAIAANGGHTRYLLVFLFPSSIVSLLVFVTIFYDLL